MIGIEFELFESSGAPKTCSVASEMLRLGRGVEMAAGEKFASARAGGLGSEAICIGMSARENFLLNVLTKKEGDLR